MKTIQYIAIIFLTVFSSIAVAQIPKLSSYPSAAATIFLDFDGQYVNGSVWNWNGPIDAQAAGFSNSAITEIFNRVSEDYRPFDLNITTDSTYYMNAPVDKRMRIIITPTSQWYGAAGGVSYVGSFTWGDNTPCWVFSALLGNNVKYVAEAVSHEAGHTLGLQHQSTFDVNCNKTAEYSAGQGSGEIGWAPIMGVGYYQNLTTWHVGPNTIGCNSIQNDFDIISTYNGFGLRADDHGNDNTTASDISVYGISFTASGLVNTATDVDAFKIVLPYATNFKLTAIPQNVGAGDAGANIDIKVTMLNYNNDTIGAYNPSTLLNAGIDTNLNAGTYYLLVDGVGNIYHNDLGSMGFYSLTGSVENVLAINNFNLKGTTNNELHQLSWTYQTDEKIQQVIIESSNDGQNFTQLAVMNPVLQAFSYKPFNTGIIYYRLRAITPANQQGYLSNIISLKDKSVAKVRAIYNSNANEITINSNGNFEYQLFTANGQLIGNGILRPGSNNIPILSAKGLLLLRYNDAGHSVVQKLIKQ